MRHKRRDHWWCDLRWRLAALVFVSLLLIGAACALWAMQQFGNSMELVHVHSAPHEHGAAPAEVAAQAFSDAQVLNGLHVSQWAALIVVANALLGAWIAGFAIGSRWEQQRRAVWLHFNEEAFAVQLSQTDVLAALPAALYKAQVDHAMARQTLQDYAQALLQTDVDGELRPAIERILAQAEVKVQGD